MTIHDELAEERDWLERLASGSLVLRGSRRDTMQYETGVAKRTIAFLEKVLARGSDGPHSLK